MSVGSFPALIAIGAVLVQGLTGLVPDVQRPAKPAPDPVAILVSLPMPPLLAPIESFTALPEIGPVLSPRPSLKKPVSVRKPKPAKARPAPPPRPPVPANVVRWQVSIRLSL